VAHCSVHEVNPTNIHWQLLRFNFSASTTHDAPTAQQADTPDLAAQSNEHQSDGRQPGELSASNGRGREMGPGIISFVQRSERFRGVFFHSYCMLCILSCDEE
jgi:hypothetical protein